MPVESNDEVGPEPTPAGNAERHELSEWAALMREARRGDETVLARLRKMLDEHAGVLGKFGDLAAHAEAA